MWFRHFGVGTIGSAPGSATLGGCERDRLEAGDDGKESGTGTGTCAGCSSELVGGAAISNDAAKWEYASAPAVVAPANL